MPNCFTLTKKSEIENGPVSLARLDDEICAHFGWQPNEIKFAYGWFDSIGCRLACGASFVQILVEFDSELHSEETEKEKEFDLKELYSGLIRIVEFLAEHYEPNAWASIGRY